MIVLKDKGKNSKIYIPRTKITNVTGGNNTTDLTDYYTKEEVDELIDNVEVDLTNYYTKEQVDELTANSSISYAVFDYDENDVVNLVAGDISKVFEDYKQHKPIMIFAPVDNRGKMGIVNCLQLLLEENGYDNDYLIGYVNYFDGDSITYRRYTFNHFGTTGYANATKNFLNYYTKTESDAKYITKGVGATIDYVDGEIGELDSSLTSKINQKQNTLVSGTNIKTINGNSLLGSGDIVVEGGSSSNIVELTQAEYDALGDNVDADTLYLISDATISANYKTINGESILGEGDIEISGGTTDLSDYYTKTECDGKFQLKGNYLTSVPNEYVTETELNDAIARLGGSDIPYVVIEYKNAMTLVVISGDLQATLTAAKNKQPFLAYFYNTYNMYGMPKNLYPFTYVYVGDDGATLRYHTEVGSSHKDITVMCEYDTETQEYTLDTLGTQQHQYITNTELTNKGYATTTYVDTQIGNINTILENIIG